MRRALAVVLALAAIPVAGAFDVPAADERSVLVQWDTVTGDEVSRVQLPAGWAVERMVPISETLTVVGLQRCITPRGRRRTDAKLVGLDTRSGRARWTVDNYRIIQSETATGITVESEPGPVVIAAPEGPTALAERIAGIGTRSGRVRWRHDLPATGAITSGDLAVVVHRRYEPASATVPRTRLTTIDASDGTTLWARERTGELLAATDGRQVVVGADPGLGSTTTAEVITRDGTTRSSFPVVGVGVAIEAGAVLARPGSGGTIAAYAPDSGAEEWRADAGYGTAVTEGVVVTSERGIPGAWRGIDAVTGAERWRIAVLRSYTSASVDGGVVVLASDGGLRGVDASTGALRWQQPYPQLTRGTYGDEDVQPSFAMATGAGRVSFARGCPVDTLR